MKLVVGLMAIAAIGWSQSADLTHAELAVQDAIQAGDIAAASRFLADAIQHHPGAGGLFNLRGIVHARQNELAAARADFGQAVRLEPKLTAGWQNLARACQGAADVESLVCAANAWGHRGAVEAWKF